MSEQGLQKTSLFVQKTNVSEQPGQDDFTQLPMAWYSIQQGQPNYPPLVFIHGWASDASIWQWIIALLPKEYPIYALDLPGFGDPHKTQVESSLEPLSSRDQNLEKLESDPFDVEITTLGIPSSIKPLLKSIASKLTEPVILIGWSLGGMIATALAGLYPTKSTGISHSGYEFAFSGNGE